MRNLKAVLIFAFFIALNANFVLAETIILKSGEKVEGKIVEKGDTYIKVDFFGVPLTHYLSDIETIDGQPVGLAQTVNPQGNPPGKQVLPGTQESRNLFTSKEAMDQAIFYSRKGDYDMALRVFKDALYPNPDLHLAMFLWGTGQDKAGKQADALHAYVMIFQAHRLYYLKMMYTRWVVYRQDGSLEQAISGLDNKIKNDPPDPSAYNARGFLYILRGDLAKALEYFNKAISLNPGYADVYLNLGILHAIQGRVDLAQAGYDKAIALNPQSADAYTLGMILSYEKQDYEEAIARFNKIIAIDPNNELAYIAAGIVEEGKNYSKYSPDANNPGELASDPALSYFNKAAGINPDNIVTYFLRSYEYFLRGSMDLVISDYSKTIALYPNDYWTYMIRAKAYEQVGDNDKSLSDLNKAKELIKEESSDSAGQSGLSAGQ